MPINTVLQEYNKNYPKWELVEYFVKEDIIALPGCLRDINPNDESMENKKRNQAYKEGAVLINVTKRTHDGMVGAVYRKDPIVELPATIEYLDSSANGNGMGLIQFSKKVLSHVMQFGRGGLLTDFPAAIEGSTIEETRERKAVIIEYLAEDIINWRLSNGKLSLVVLKEKHCEDVDGFVNNELEQYRELRIENGYYVQRVWRQVSVGVADYAVIQEGFVTGYSGEILKEITFTFVGTVNNDSEVDPSLLYSIAAINKGYYQNSADLEENCFIHGQLTLGVSSKLDATSWELVNPNGIMVGARKGHFLGDGGGFHSVQAQPNQLADTLMARKEHQMVMIGARLIQSGSNEREVAVLSRIGAETATLSSLAANVSSAMRQSLVWSEGYMSNIVSEITFTLNQDFFPKTFDSQQIMGLIQLYDRGAIAASDLHSNLQAASILSDSRDRDDVQEEADTLNPLMTTVTPFNA